MNLKELQDEDRIQGHDTSKKEISNLFGIVKRDIKDSRVKELSSDRRFCTAYNAVLQLATILLYSEGYKAKSYGHHFYTFQAIKSILDNKYNELIDYFDDCRIKRNTTFYNQSGIASKKEVEELIKESEKFKDIVIKYLKRKHPELLPEKY